MSESEIKTAAVQQWNAKFPDESVTAEEVVLSRKRPGQYDITYQRDGDVVGNATWTTGADGKATFSGPRKE